jgi:succinate-semialdehyde dehydrogenase/glutarate-semialdehyde dehydrogenase
MKESGIVREGSRYGIDDFLEINYLYIGGIGAIVLAIWNRRL